MRIVSVLAATAVLAALTGAPVHATSNYAYKKHEYPTIGGGRAPNGRNAIAAHGEGDDGYDDFHLYLMASRRIIQSLPDIESKNILDTSPKAYDAYWSPDSRHVAVTFRRDRHSLELRLYDIRERHVRRILTPDPIGRFIEKTQTTPDDLRARLISISWLSPTRFRLKQQTVYRVPSRELARVLGPFGREEINSEAETTDSEGKPVTWSVVQASLDVIYDVRHGSRVRRISMKPGEFDEP
jgi:hypothetical protein